MKEAKEPMQYKEERHNSSTIMWDEPNFKIKSTDTDEVTYEQLLLVEAACQTLTDYTIN